MILNLFSKMAKREIHGNVWGVCVDFNASSVVRLGTSNDSNPDPYGLVNTLSTNSLPFTGMKEYYYSSGNFYSVPGNYSLVVSNNGTGRLNILRENDIYVYIPEFFYLVYDDPINNKRYYYIASESNNGLFLRHPGSNRYVGKYLMDRDKYVRSGRSTYNSIFNPYAASGSISCPWYDGPDECYELTSKGCFYSLDIITYCTIILLRLIQEVSFSFNNYIMHAIINPYVTGTTDGTSNDNTVLKTGYYTDSSGGIHYKFNNIEDFFLPNATPIIGITEYNSYIYINMSNLSKFIPTSENISLYFTRVDSSRMIPNLSNNADIKKLLFIQSYKWLFYPDLQTASSTSLGKIGASTTAVLPSVHLIDYYRSNSMLDILIQQNGGSSNVHFPRKIFIPNS